MKKILTIAVLCLTSAVFADRSWVRVNFEPNLNKGDANPCLENAAKYTVYYAPTNGYGNTAEEISLKLKDLDFSPKQFGEKFTKLTQPAATYSRNDQQYTFTAYDADVDPTKAYFAVILCSGDDTYWYYYKVIGPRQSNYDHYLSGQPNEECSAHHLSFGSYYEIDLMYADTSDWAEGKLTPASEPEHLIPGGQSEVEYDSEAAAAAAAAEVVITPADEVAKVLVDESAYTAFFEVTQTQKGDKWINEAVLTETAELDLQTQVDNDALLLEPQNIVANSDGIDIEVNSYPGFYYSLKSGTGFDDMTEGARVLATGDKVTLRMPNMGKTGLYRVVVNIDAGAVAE